MKREFLTFFLKFARKMNNMSASAIERFLAANRYPRFAPRAFFFDMDGVLFNSMPRHAKAWVETMRQMGIEFTERDAFLNEGQTGRRIIDLYVRKTYGRPSTAEEQEKYYRLKSDLFDAGGIPEPIDGVADVLQALKEAGCQIFVVTGSGQASLLGNLELHFPGIFRQEKMITAHDVRHGKPHPEPYLMALEKSGVQPWEGVVVENAPLGVQAGHAARLFTIGVNTGILPPGLLKDAGADIELQNMHQLLAALKNANIA